MPSQQPFDVLIFQSWSLGAYAISLLGPAYRLSLLGAFSAPIALLLIVVALIAPISREIVRRPGINPWVETHAALSHHRLWRTLGSPVWLASCYSAAGAAVEVAESLIIALQPPAD